MTNKNYKEEIVRLRREGKTYAEIKELTGASKGTISYHLGEGQKEKSYERNLVRRISMDPLDRKLERFKHSELTNWIPKESSYKRPEGKSINRRISNQIKGFHMDNEVAISKTGLKGIHTSDLTFTIEDIKQKAQNGCYLTGRSINLSESRTFELDHKIPRSRGGSNELSNCEVTCKEANRAKGDLTLDEFFKLCVDVVKHNGLKIE